MSLCPHPEAIPCFSHPTVSPSETKLDVCLDFARFRYLLQKYTEGKVIKLSNVGIAFTLETTVTCKYEGIFRRLEIDFGL